MIPHTTREEIVSYEDRTECRPIIDGILSRSPERGDSLDIGSGDGCFSFQLSQLGYRPFLIDLDPRAEQAAAHVPGAIFSRTRFEDFHANRPLSAIIMSQILGMPSIPCNGSAARRRCSVHKAFWQSPCQTLPAPTAYSDGETLSLFRRFISITSRRLH